MLLPLIEKIRESREDMNVLLTSGTVTSARLMAARLPAGVIHQYVPLDSPKYVDRFLSHWKPDMAIWAESEIWPNLIAGAKSSGAKLALINARMSASSLSTWKKRGQSAAAVFKKFDLILAAEAMTADGLSEILGSKVNMTGNLKHAALPLPASEKKLIALKAAIADRPVWCAASTHHGEDAAALAAHKNILQDNPNTLLIIAPRHPERREDIVELINQHGLSFTARASGTLPDAKTQVYLFDTIGEMGLVFRAASMTLMCGSLLKGLSGHNPLEPAKLHSAVISGPYVSSFADDYKAMANEGAVLNVHSAGDIAETLNTYLFNSKKLKAQQQAAFKFAQSRADILEDVWAQLQPLLLQPLIAQKSPA